MNQNRLFGSILLLVVGLTVVALFIFGFDMQNKGKSTKKMVNLMKNDGKTDYSYRITDNFAFRVLDTDQEQPTILVSSYTTNYIPFCYICGWYTTDLEDQRNILAPRLHQQKIYSAAPTVRAFGDIPKGHYTLLDLQTGEFSHTDNLATVGIPSADAGKLLGPIDIANNYDEISYENQDDEDCMIVFGALAIFYILLAMWGGMLSIRHYLSSQSTTE